MSDTPLIKVFETKDNSNFIYWCPFCKTYHFIPAGILGRVSSNCKNEESPYFNKSILIKIYREEEIALFDLPKN